MKRTEEKKRAARIFSLLEKHYPDAKIVLKYSNPWELLVAVVLSAQCTDKMVNKVTRRLFRKYRKIEDYATADLTEFEQDIRPTGFYRSKARYIITSAQIILKEHGGRVPERMEELLKLPGVARKTANIILGNAFGKVEGIAVDTHVKRLAQRLGLSKHQDPNKIEQDLMRLFPRRHWFKLTYLLIEHGRRVCQAQKPACDRCFLNELCPSAFSFPHFQKGSSSFKDSKR